MINPQTLAPGHKQHERFRLSNLGEGIEFFHLKNQYRRTHHNKFIFQSFLLSMKSCPSFFHRVYRVRMDSISPEKRSWVMAQVKGRNTRPEKAVRSLLHHMGYRFRLQRKDLPGKPDIVLPKYRTAIFVHGCYWHRHDCPNGRRLPKSRLDFWLPKLEGNRERDIKKQDFLREQGWNILVIWECMLRDEITLQEVIRAFFRDAIRK